MSVGVLILHFISHVGAESPLHWPGVSSGCDPARLLPLVWHSGSVLAERAALLAWQMGPISSPVQEGKPPAACPNAQSALLTMMNSTSWIESSNSATHTHTQSASFLIRRNQSIWRWRDERDVSVKFDLFGTRLLFDSFRKEEICWSVWGLNLIRGLWVSFKMMIY